MMTSRFSLTLFSCFAIVLGLAVVTPVAYAQAAATGRSQPVDHIAAVVNNEVITGFELQQSVGQAMAQLARRGGNQPPQDVVARQVLETLIMQRIQLQAARAAGIEVDDTALARTIERIAGANNASEEQMRAALEQDGISWTRFREQVRAEMTTARLREVEIERSVMVSEAEVDNFIAANPQAFSGREYLIAHILFATPASPSRADLERVEARAAEVRQRLAAGENFGELATRYSDASDALGGGVIDWRSGDRLPALFEGVVGNMRPGQVSEPLRSSAGLHLVMLLDTRGGELAGALGDVPQTHARHILIKTSEVVSDADAEGRLRTLRERIVNGESFEALARANSADITSTRGGDLGWVSQGDTVPEFERQMDELAPNEVSQPFQSPFGWHIVQVLERRVQGASDENKRNAARMALHNRKTEEAFNNWLREQRDSAYVDIRLESLEP